MKRICLAFLSTVVFVLTGCAEPPAPTGTPLSTLTERSTWKSGYEGGERIVTSHYCIYSTVHTEVLQRHLPGFMEAAYRNYCRLTGLKNLRPSRPMPIYMLGTRAEWAALTKKATGPLAEKYLGIAAGGYCHKGICVFWDIGAFATFSIASHEGLHQFFHHRLKHRLPAWLEEGFCVTSEGYVIEQDRVRFTPDRNVMRFSNLRTAMVNGWWIPLDKLLPMDAGDMITGLTQKAVGYYGQLWALVGFIRSHDEYQKGLRRLLSDAETGNLHKALNVTEKDMREMLRWGRAYNRFVSEKLFRYYFTDDLKGFDREFYQFSKRLVNLD